MTFKLFGILCIFGAIIISNTAIPFFGFGNLNFFGPATPSPAEQAQEKEMHDTSHVLSLLHKQSGRIKEVARALVMLSREQAMIKEAAEHLALKNSTAMRKAAVALMKLNAEDSNIRRAAKELVSLHAHKLQIYQGAKAASVMCTLKTHGYNVF